MKTIFFTFLLASLYYLSNAQTTANDAVYQANAVKQASLMAGLLLKKDYKAFTKFTYPPILKMFGGLDKMTGYLETSLKKMEEGGMTITNASVGSCSKIIHTKTQLQCTLPETIEMQHATEKLIQKSTIIGISNDQGKNWTFIDTHGKPLKDLQATIKELSNELVIPKQESPAVAPK